MTFHQILVSITAGIVLANLGWFIDTMFRGIMAGFLYLVPCFFGVVLLVITRGIDKI